MNDVLYLARNQSNDQVVGRAVPSVAPGLAAQYFHKVQCFCFTEQTLGPREEREMPVRFVIDPNLPAEVATVTLSYTFYESTANKQEQPATGSNLPPIMDHTEHGKQIPL